MLNELWTAMILFLLNISVNGVKCTMATEAPYTLHVSNPSYGGKPLHCSFA